MSGVPATSAWQWAVLVFFAYDIGGGAVANMLNSCKRFYHTPAEPGEGAFIRAAKNVRVFTAIHVHPIIAAALLGGSVSNAVAWYVALQIAVWLVLATPLYLRRPLATLLWPPPIHESSPEAVLLLPPLTLAYKPAASFPRPPLTLAYDAVASLSRPPAAYVKEPSALFDAPPPTVAP